MHTQPTRRSSLFLMELMIAILFFSLAAAVCVRLFVKSHTLEAESIELNHAVTSATSVAEVLRSQDEPYTILVRQFPQGEQNADSFEIFYDNDWKLCSSSDSVYRVSLQTDIFGNFLIGTIKVYKESDSLYQLTVKKYLAKEGISS